MTATLAAGWFCTVDLNYSKYWGENKKLFSAGVKKNFVLINLIFTALKLHEECFFV